MLPGAFIPPAERYHLMGAIDRWVIETALQWYANLFEAQSPIKICLNLSGNSLTDEHLLPFVVERLRSAAISSERICFEITETAAIRNVVQATHFITALTRPRTVAMTTTTGNRGEPRDPLESPHAPMLYRDLDLALGRVSR